VRETADLLTKVAKQFDPTDPTSPMARQAAELTAHQKALTRSTAPHDAKNTLVQRLSSSFPACGHGV